MMGSDPVRTPFDSELAYCYRFTITREIRNICNRKNPFMAKPSTINSFKVDSISGDTRIEMTGEGLLIPLDGTMRPDVRVWQALSGVIAEAAGAPALVDRLTEAFHGGRASMRANKDGSGLIFTFDEGSIPTSVQQTLVRLGESETTTLDLLNNAVARGERNAAAFRKRFPHGPGHISPGGQSRDL
jgi:hypothetical protein